MQKYLDETWVGHVVSQGTLKDEDLIETFENFLLKHGHTTQRLMMFLQKPEDNESDESRSIYLNEVLFSLMNEIAPEGTYFGASEGDGSLFGFWKVEEELDGETYDCEEDNAE